MTLPLNPQRAFGEGCCVINLPAELERQDGVVGALNYHDRRGDFFQFGNRVELRVNEKVHAGEKPKQFAGGSRRRRKGRLEDEATNLAVGSKVGGHGRPQRLTERQDGFGVKTFCVDEELIRCIGIEIKAGFGWLAFAMAIAAIFQRKDIAGCVAQKLIDVLTIGNVGCISVEC